MGFLDLIGNLIKYFVFLSVALVVALVIYFYISGEAYLPHGYYAAAREMYGDVGTHDLKNLTAVLNRTILPPYKKGVFGSTEASSYMEWYLEGHGFKAFVARSDVLHHTWVIVELDSGERVAIEPVMLTENKYSPPGIIDSPDGRYRNVSVTWKEYLAKNEKKPYSEFLRDYWYYYNPPKIFDNPGQMIGIGSSLRYPGWAKLSYDDIDWWNSEPFNRTYPFSGWD